MKLDQVSIIIVTYKGDEILFNCLESLAATCGEEPQIVVVDNSPSKSTRSLVDKYPNAIYVESPGNPGFTGGNNRALPYCDRKYVLLLNNDTIVRSRKSIEQLVAFMELHPQCGVAQGTIILQNTEEVVISGGCGSFLTPFGFQYARGFAVPLDTPGLNREIQCFTITGAFMMFPRNLVAYENSRIGFLFHRHFWAYYEEVDFCHRVWLSGKEVWYVPTDPIEHLCGYTAGKFKRSEIMRQYMRNSFFSLRVNLGLLARMTILPIYYFVMLMHALVHLVRKDKATFDADMEIFKDIFRMRKEVCAARKRVIRYVSDWWIFRRTLRLPPISYLLRTVSLNI